jgi:hypothetical protein
MTLLFAIAITTVDNYPNSKEAVDSIVDPKIADVDPAVANIHSISDFVVDAVVDAIVLSVLPNIDIFSSMLILLPFTFVTKTPIPSFQSSKIQMQQIVFDGLHHRCTTNTSTLCLYIFCFCHHCNFFLNNKLLVMHGSFFAGLLETQACLNSSSNTPNKAKLLLHQEMHIFFTSIRSLLSFTL